MKTKHLYPLVAGLLLASMTSSFAFPCFDPFADATGSGGTAYTAGDLLGGKKNAFGDSWSTISSTSTGAGPVAVFAGSLTPSYDTFPSDFFPVTPGNSIELKNIVSKGARLNLGQSFVTNAVYYSFFMKADSVTSLSTAAVGTFMIALNSGSGASSGGYSDNYNAEIRMKRDSAVTSSYFIGVSKNGPASSDVAYAPAEFTINDTLFVVVSHDYNSDRATIWVNPVVSSLAQTAPPSATASNSIPASSANANTATIASLAMMDRITSQANHMIVDDVRVGTTWMYVTGGPEIGTQPAATVTANAGDTSATISVSARSGNSSSLTYKWQKGGANITDGNASGTTTATLTISSPLAVNNGIYTCIVSNSVGSVTSTNCTLTVTDPYITSQPVANQQIPPGGTAMMSVVAAGTSPITYQWQKGGVNLSNGSQPTTSTVAGATTANLTISGMATGDADVYTCVVSSGAPGSITSSNSVLQVQDPSVTSQPTDAAKLYGDSATFQIAAAGTTPLTYQWQRNGVNLTEGGATGGGGTASGVQTVTLSLTGLAFSDAGSYSCIVSNGLTASTVSSNGVLTVQDPVFTAQPASATVLQGGATNFTVTAAGSPTITYQWYKGATALVNGAGITGSTAAALSLSSITSSQAGNYKCVILGADTLSRTSSVATLTVTVPVTIAEAPASRALRVGDHTALTVVAAGTGPITYQWSNSGGPIANATDSVLAFASLALSDSDTYSVVVSNSVGTATTNATVNVSNSRRTFTANNLVVSRLGDGAQPLIVTNGNTIYIDQYTTGGSYVSSLMIPDTGADALVAAGQDNSGGTLGLGEACLTPSPDGTVLALSGYNVARPYNSSLAISSDNASVAPRGVGLVSGLGNYQLGLRVANSSITGGFRAAMTDNTQTNFWLVGGNLSVRYFNSGSTGAGTLIATGGTSGNNRYIGTFNGDIFMDAATSAGGIYDISGLPKVATAATQLFAYPTLNLINEFAVSPDGNTIYLATGAINNSTGTGIERWDKSGLTWASNAVFSTGVGARGLVVDWSAFTGGGSSGTGAAVYFTTAETNDNTIVQLLDNGTATLNVLAKSGTNTVFRSVKLAPTSVAPTITAGPVDTTIATGGTLTLTCSVTGSAPLTFSWTKDGNPITDGPSVGGGTISGSSTSTLTIQNAGSADAGSYAVASVSNDVGSAGPSSAAAVTVLGGISITSTPVTITANYGDTVVFTVAATGNSPVYHWQRNGNNLTDGTYDGATVTGSTTASLTIAGVNDAWGNATTATNYTCIVSNAVNSASQTDGLQVIDPAITSQPANTTAECGSSPVLSVTAVGTGTLTYQWYTPDTSGTAISGATGASYTVSSASGVSTYAVVVTGSSGTATSSTATVTVQDTTPPVVTVTGANPDSVCLNSGVYSDAGATYTDTCDGSGAASASGPVDTTILGSYTRTYSFTDASGNTGTATRVVNVVDCNIAITVQPQNQLKQPQGTNVALTVTATGAGLTYQWYENNVLIPGATGATNSFVAHTNAITGTNLTYYVVVSNAVTSVQSSSALVTVLKDIIKPALIVTAPLNNTRAQSFTVKGKTTDTHGNDAKLKYFWTGITTPGTSPTYSIDISGVGIDPTKRDFTGSGFALTNPPSAGTNTLTIWVEDLAGNASSPAKVVKVFWQVPHTYALTISGDGTGSVKVSTKGAPQEVVAGAPTGTLVGSANTVYNMSLYAHQVYSIKYTPDPKLDHPTAGTSIASVVSNAVPVELAGTTTTRAQTVTFTAGDTDTSANVSFARNRFVDMAGTYNGVFTGLTNVASSRLFVMTISPTRTVSGYLMDATKTKTTFTAHQTLNADGSGTIVAGGITISGSLAWTGSEDPNGVKEFIGSATDGSWTAALTAEKADKTALPTEGFATMQIPGGFGGSGFATVHSKNGTITAIYTLADDDKHAVSFAMMGNRSKNIPQWITSTHSGGLLFGNLIVDDGLTNLSAPALSWIRPSGNLFYPALLPAGFTNSPFAAVCSPFLAGSKLNGTYTLNITGGGLANDITSQTVTFTDSKMTAAGKVKVGLMDPFGKLKFTFQDGTTPTHTTIAVGALLQNATNGVGFFIKPLGTDAGNVSLTPQ